MRLLHRYVVTELLRIFLLSLAALTLLLVAVGVVGEASRHGLGSGQILQILPYVLPATMPYTIPATLLFSVSLVYGRMSGDNEITALKSAGISVWSIIWPSLGVGVLLSAVTMCFIDRFIPWANLGLRTTVLNAAEDILYGVLRREKVFYDRQAGWSITVRNVVGRKLIRPTIRFKPAGSSTGLTIQADEATITINPAKGNASLRVVNAKVALSNGARYVFADHVFPIELPSIAAKIKPRDLTLEQIHKRLGEVYVERDEFERRRAVETTFLFFEGRLTELFKPPSRHEQYRQEELGHENDRLRTEVAMRWSMASGCFCFVVLGSPIAILQRRRDFLTNFMTCFLPIMLIYYPLLLGMQNLSKDGRVLPAALWLGNAGIAAWGLLVLRKVLRH